MTGIQVRLGRHLDDLAARGLVLRVPGEDKRQRMVRLTSAGQAAYRHTKEAIRDVEDALLAEAFTPAQAASLRRNLERLAHICTAP